MWMEMLIRFTVGGSLIVLVSLVSKSKLPHLSGLLVLFPIVTVIGFFFIGRTASPRQLQNIALFSIVSFPTTLGFLISFYCFLHRYSYRSSILLSVLVWFIIAVLVIVVNKYLLHIK